jgi:general secretion pathway protein D
VLRLRDGETQVLAGLINEEDRRISTEVPGLAQLPVLGRLFRADNDNVNKTEVVLLITPHVVRNVERPAAHIEQFNSGTELEVGRGGVAPVLVRPIPPGAPGQAPAPAPRQAPAPGQAPAPAQGQAPAPGQAAPAQGQAPAPEEVPAPPAAPAPPPYAPPPASILPPPRP